MESINTLDVTAYPVFLDGARSYQILSLSWGEVAHSHDLLTIDFHLPSIERMDEINVGEDILFEDFIIPQEAERGNAHSLAIFFEDSYVQREIVSHRNRAFYRGGEPDGESPRPPAPLYYVVEFPYFTIERVALGGPPWTVGSQHQFPCIRWTCYGSPAPYVKQVRVIPERWEHRGV